MALLPAIFIAACGPVTPVSPPPTCGPEVWYDGVDEACDGGSDFDADGDGSPGGSETSPDCDDGDPTVFPGAPRICGDGEDSDCDGLDDCALRGSLVIEDAASGELLSSGTSIEDGAADFDGDGVPEWLVEWYPAAYESLLLIRPFSSGLVETSDAVEALIPNGLLVRYGPEGGSSGDDLAVLSWGLGEQTVSVYRDPELDPVPDGQIALGTIPPFDLAIGDVSGDGVGDVVVGGMGSEPGSSWVFAGPVAADVPLDGAIAQLISDADFPVDVLGRKLDARGDLTGDGATDVVAQETIGGASPDRATLFPGPLAGTRFSSAEIGVGTEGDGLSTGLVFDASTDWNQDGYDDFIVADDSEDVGVSIFDGPWTADRGASEFDARVNGYDGGLDGAPVGDLNGDGFPDLGVVVDEGRYAFLYGPFEGTAPGSREPDFEVVAATGTLQTLGGVQGVGDIDGDGADDLLLSVLQADGQFDDYVLSGRLAGW